MKINLYFFISNFNFGGAGNAIFVFLKNLNPKKFNLHMICIGHSDYERLLPKYVKFYSFNHNFFMFKTFFNFFSIKSLMLSLIKKDQKNIFISNIHFSNILSIFFLRKIDNLKIVLFERTSLKELDILINLKSFIKNKIVKFLINYKYKQADLILSNSKSTQREFGKINLKSKVVYSGAIKNLQKKKKKYSKGASNIICVGRLEKQKDYFTLINAINLIKKKKFTLKIFGEGVLKERIKELIKEKKLEKKIIMMGHKNIKSEIYKNADLLVHCSLFEGLPNVLVEAMNHNIPMIAAKSTGGINEILCSGKYGDMFEPQNFMELSKKISKFLDDPTKLRKKVLNSKIFLKKFTHINCSKKLEKILIKI